MTRFTPAGVLAAVAAVALAAPGQARYIRVEIEKVPVDRLAKSLGEAVEKNPKDVAAIVNLARTHAMAYTLKTDTVDVAKGRANQGIWFGYEPKFVPFGEIVKTDNADRVKAAAAHLAKALELYKRAVELDPKNLPARLGHAWVLEQAGKKDEAVAAYRKLLEDAWTKEKDLTALGLGGHTITVEAAGYLIPLLDKTKDKDEIATLTERSEKLKKLPRPITPIAIPLRPNLTAADIEDRAAAVAFDADGSGLKKSWSWITPEAAWLVHDPAGKGEIHSALQLFGNVTFWLFWETGYDALAALDDNRDGKVSGSELNGLALWHDVNRNGVADPGEVKPLAAYGITALSCRYQRDSRHPDRIAFSAAGVTFRDGTTRPTYDIILHPREGK